MMGHSHAISGALSAAILATTLPNLIPHAPASYTLACVIAAGAAVAPDADHPDARAARTFGSITRLIAAISGGHRHGTHTLWAAALVAATCWFSTAWQPAPLGHAVTPVAGLVVFTTTALGLAALTGWRRPIVLTIALFAGVTAAATAPSPAWLSLTTTAGYLTHLLGDVITTQGVKILRPLPPTIRVPVLGNAGSAREHVLAGLLALAWVLLTVSLYYPLFPAQ